MQRLVVSSPFNRSVHGCAASEYHELVREGGHVPPERSEQKAGQIGRKADLDGLTARRVRGMDAPNHTFYLLIN